MSFGILNSKHYLAIVCIHWILSCWYLHCHNNANVLHTYCELMLTFVNIGVYSPFNDSLICQRFLPNEQLLSYA